MDAVQRLTSEQILENLLTTDFQGKAFKRACLLRVLEDHDLRDSLLFKLRNG